VSEPILVPSGLAKHWENEARHAWHENARLKAEVDRLQSIHSIDSIAIEQLKSEVERLTKAGDELALDYAERIEIEAGETAKTLMNIVPVLRDWNAAKGVQS